MKIAIDAGHGLHTSGKRCLASIDPNQTREWALNSRVASYVCDFLAAQGVNTLRVDDITGATDVPLASRTSAANSAKADYYVSIHHNAGINGGSGGGPVVFVYNGQHSAQSDVLQANIYNGIINACGKFGNRAAPLAASNLYVLRHTNMPAVLVECGFMDSTVDTPMILTDDFARKCADGIARGICATAGIAYNGSSASTTEPVPSAPSAGADTDAEAETDIPTGYPAQFQSWLNEGYGAGLDVDGLWGPKTKRGAIRALQTELNAQFGAGLSVDGLWGPKTKAACVNVRQGAKGNLTRIIQGRLYCMGYDPNGFDGSFGPGCAAAVKRYQANKGLSADGIVGRNTWAALLG